MNTKYEDTQIIISDDKLEIKRYYFPLGKSKIINFSEIRGIEELELSYSNGKGRIWGMGLAPYWFNWDNNRFWRKKGIIIKLGKSVNPAITPDNQEEVMRILKEKIR